MTWTCQALWCPIYFGSFIWSHLVQSSPYNIPYDSQQPFPSKLRSIGTKRRDWILTVAPSLAGQMIPGMLLNVLQLVWLVSDSTSLKGPKIMHLIKHLENGNYVAYFYTQAGIKAQRGELICSLSQGSGRAANETKNIHSGHRLIIRHILYRFSHFCRTLSHRTT